MNFSSHCQLDTEIYSKQGERDVQPEGKMSMQMEQGNSAASTSSSMIKKSLLKRKSSTKIVRSPAAKRKSSGANVPILRSPLSRMLLSPRIHLFGAKRVKSPLVTHRTSPSATLKRSLSPSATSFSLVVATTPSLSHDSLGDILDLNVQPPEEDNSELNVPSSSRVGDIDLNVQLPEEDNSELSVLSSSRVGDIDLNFELQEEEDNYESLIGGSYVQENAHRNEVSNEKRRLIFEALLTRANNGELKGHETGEVSALFSVPKRTVQHIWKKGKSCLDQGILVDVSSGKSKCGRKKVEVDVSIIRDLPLSSRTTLDDLRSHLNVSKGKLLSMKRKGIIKRVSNSLKPYLTDKNKQDRLKWCISMLDPRSLPNDPIFKGLFDFVFIDEKWFNITRKTERYYTVPGEDEPTRTCKNKNYIPKIMFLTALARPRFDSNGTCIFDGKIGCFPFVTYEAARRSSANRPAGTVEMKPIESITKGVIRTFLIEKVLPAIRARWPREDANKPIYIQQDNAPTHVACTDKMFCDAAKQDGFDIQIICQPANSPDFNILDLGFFSSIQSIQYKTTAKTTLELVAAVDKAYQDYSVWKSNRIFLTLHGCMKEAMKVGGGNRYDIPHIKKEMLERQGRLPLQISCDASLVHEVMTQISE